jgi:hypothetical protein
MAGSRLKRYSYDDTYMRCYLGHASLASRPSGHLVPDTNVPWYALEMFLELMRNFILVGVPGVREINEEE